MHQGHSVQNVRQILIDGIRVSQGEILPLPLTPFAWDKPSHTFTDRKLPRRTIMDLDLDGFNTSLIGVDDPPVGGDFVGTGPGDAQSALLYIDDKWYGERNRRNRRMDLIGDYAGTEPFVLDGDNHLS